MKGVECKIKGGRPNRRLGHCLHIVFGRVPKVGGRPPSIYFTQVLWVFAGGPQAKLGFFSCVRRNHASR